MSTKIKERLKRLMLELDSEGRNIFDRMIEKASGKTCDEAIELLTDDQVRVVVERIKKKARKRLVLSA